MILRLLLALLALAVASPARAEDGRWVTAWATAPIALEPADILPPEQARDATLRQTVLLTAGGTSLRIRLSNRLGTAPLALSGVHVARAPAAGAASIVAGTDRAVTFSGAGQVTIPAGAEMVSDPVALPVEALTHLSITIHLVAPEGIQTGHPGSRTHSHLLRGRHLAATALEGAAAIAHWYYITGVDVRGGAGTGAIAILGDSITDGFGVVPDSDGRWPDYLARRLQADAGTRHLSVANLGISGNRVLLDGLGPNALARFDRDVLALPGVRYLIILIGVNDLGMLTRDAPATPAEHEALVAGMIAGYRQMALRARERGIRVIGATILPYGASEYYHPDARNEADRQALNAWIRAPGNVDAVLDFDALMRDPERPERMRADLDIGDGLHPSDAGYRAMADAVPLGLFRPEAPEIVLTFDDLPLHGPLPPGESAAAVARSILDTLAAHGVKEAYGFANAALAEDDPALGEVLGLWHRSGLGLANHGWSHARIDDLTAEGFARELTRNAAALDRITGGGPRYFRYPYLAEGKEAGLRDAARRTLADNGHRIAPVSMDFSDWAFNSAYARCVGTGDSRSIEGLEQAFLARAEATANSARALSAKLYGRDIPYVLLLHSGAFTARMLPRLLALYDRLGYRYGRLADALDDPAFAAARDPAIAFEPSTLTLRGSLGPEAPRAPPETDPEGFCRAEAR